MLRSSLSNSRKFLPFPSDAWNVIFQSLIGSSLSDFLQNSQEILLGKEGVTTKDLESLSTAWWSFHLSLLGHFQNSIELESLVMKKFQRLLRIAAEWIWNGCEPGSKIFLATWMESVMTMILETLFKEHAWLMPHLIANNSTSELITKEAWWMVLMRGRLTEWICAMDVAISFLMLVLVMTKAVFGIEEFRRTISSSS